MLASNTDVAHESSRQYRLHTCSASSSASVERLRRGRLALLSLAFAAGLIAVVASPVFAQSTSISGSVSGNRSFNASSGTATITGNATLAGATTFSLNFGVEYLVIGGGGSGAQAKGDGAGGAGGAGGYRSSVPGALSGSNSSAEPILSFTSSTSATVVVGKGGVGAGTAMGNDGDNSSFAGIVSIGGGGGGGSSNDYYVAGRPGGSGGGSTDTSTPVGAGTAGQGFAGGMGISGAVSGGGGGGAGGAGGNASYSFGGTGGAGLSSWITGVSIERARGGTGRRYTDTGTSASGAANTGNGGQGGATNQPGGSGGTGIVIARYFGSQFATGGSATVGTGSSAGYTVHEFTTTAGVTSTSSFVLPDLNSRLGATVTGTLSGGGSLNVDTQGIIALSAANTYTGTTTVSSGILQINAANAIQSTSGVGIANAARFRYAGGNGTFDRTISVTSGTGTVENTGAGTLTLSGTLTKNGTGLQLSGGAFNVTGPIIDSVASGDFRVSGSAAVTLSSANTFGATTRIENGSLTVGAALALQNSTVDMATGDSGTLAFNQNSTLGGLTGSRNVALGGFTVSIGNNNASSSYTGVLSNGAVSKVGTGTLTLTQASTYSGATTIRGGVLALNVGNAIANSGTIVVGDTGSTGAVLDVSVAAINDPGAAYAFGAGQVLTGKGTIQGAALGGESVSVAGLLAPGNSPGILTFADIDVNFTSTANTLMEITGTAAGTQYDVVRLTGDGVLTYGGTLTLDFSQAFADNTTFNLFQITSGTALSSFSSVVSTGSFYAGTFTETGSGVFSLTSGGQTLTFTPNVAGTGVSYGQLVIVPEPLTLGLFGIGGSGAVMGLRLFRRRRAGRTVTSV